MLKACSSAAMLLASARPLPIRAAKAPTIAKELQQAKTYTICSAPTAPLEMAKPALPDSDRLHRCGHRKEDRAQPTGQSQHPPHDAGRRAQGLHRRR